MRYEKHLIKYYIKTWISTPKFGPLSFLGETKSTCQGYDTTASQVMLKHQEGIAVAYTPLLGINGVDQTKVKWIMLSAT